MPEVRSWVKPTRLGRILDLVKTDNGYCSTWQWKPSIFVPYTIQMSIILLFDNTLSSNKQSHWWWVLGGDQNYIGRKIKSHLIATSDLVVANGHFIDFPRSYSSHWRNIHWYWQWILCCQLYQQGSSLPWDWSRKNSKENFCCMPNKVKWIAKTVSNYERQTDW